MATDTGTRRESPLEPPPDLRVGSKTGTAAADAAGAPVEEVRWKKRRKRLGRRNRDKFPRWVRALIWMMTPVVLWLGIYALGQYLL